METVTWKIKNIKTGEILNISKSVFTVGRKVNADLTSINSVLSRNHATLLTLTDGSLNIQDKNSCNGTFVNNQKIPVMEIKSLNPGDIIGFGICEEIATNQVPDVPHLIFEVLKNENVDGSDTTDIKKEKDDTPKLPIPAFSTDAGSDCIVISDGEENDSLIACSQIFKFSEKIKNEQDSFMESVDPYAHIKQELEDLDYCDNRNIEVDLTERDHFDSTCELINILESPVPIKAVEGDERDDKEHSSKLSKSKYVKPPVIEPHSFNKPSNKERNKSLQPTDKCQNLTRKRKNVAASPKPNKKNKSNNTLVKSRYDKKTIDEEFKKRHKVKSCTPQKKEINKESKNIIKSERKKKLKEITEKAKGPDDIIKVRKSPSKIKTSNARGNFLLHDNVITTTTRIENRTKPTPSTSKSLLKSNMNDTSNFSSRIKTNSTHTKKDLENNQIQDTTVSSNCSPESYKNISHTFNPFTSLDKDTNLKKIDPRREVQNFGLISTNSNNHRSFSNNNKNIVVNIDPEICSMVHWTVNWLHEQRNFEISPPVNGDKQLVTIPLSYNSYNDYFNTVTPLILLELWQYVHQTVYDKDQDRTPMRILLMHKRVVENLMYLDCECYIPKEDVIKNNVFRPDDFTFIEMKVKDPRSFYVYSGFGYITCCRRVDMNDDTIINKEVAELCSSIPHTHLKFTLVTRHLVGKEISSKELVIKVIGNIATYLKLIKTVKSLAFSPMCSQILHPNIEDYKISAEHSQLLIEVHLNSYQKKIVLEASSLCLRDEPGLYMIKGPPGTGKSTVIVNIVLQILFSNTNNKKNPLILLTAPSNAAVDNLILKLAEVRTKLSEHQRKFLKLVRMGPDSSISKSVDKFKLTSLAGNHILKERELFTTEDFKNALEKGLDIQQFLKQYLGYKYFYEIKCAEDILLFGCNVICTTLNSCVSIRIMDLCRRDKLNFSCCIVDEATQCSEPECLLPIQLGIDKFVLVGDPKQLPAVVCNKDAQKFGYGKSLFARIDDNFNTRPDNPVKMLYEQYRMKPEICDYPNKIFYGGKLKSSPIHTNKIIPEIKPYLLFNLMVSEYQDNSDYRNSEEAQFIHTLLLTLHNFIKKDCRYSIGVVTPYRAQKDLITRMISNIRFNPNVTVTVNTIDSFQGMENDIIIISCVRYSPNNFLQNEQRLNVALTRARQALYIIGNYTLFKQCRLFYDIREDAKKRKMCLDISDSVRNITSLQKFIMQK